MNKEILPKEVAEAIERCRLKYSSNWALIHQVSGALFSEDLLTIKEWAVKSNSGSMDKLMNALVNGYEVEKTPEENVREYYESIERMAKRMHERADHEEESHALSELVGIKTTLNKLGIAIEGVNK